LRPILFPKHIRTSIPTEKIWALPSRGRDVSLLSLRGHSDSVIIDFSCFVLFYFWMNGLGLYS
jgi:hypothetical protein